MSCENHLPQVIPVLGFDELHVVKGTLEFSSQPIILVL